MFQYEKGNPLPIVAPDVIFHEVLEKVRDGGKKIIGKDV